MRFFTKFISLCGSALFTLTTIGLATITGFYFYYSPQLPDSDDLQQIELQVPLRIYSRDEKMIAEYGTKRRRPVTLDQVPDHLREAFIAIEDARYYEHQGIDFIGIARALYSVISTGRASQGASTITMQLARNTFLDSRKTLERKLKETLLAFKLERTLSKDEILELYLNKIYLGNRAHGIAAAAETYYGKERLEDLTLAQMAMIAGLPKAPSRYNPIVNPERAMIRRDYILKRMLELNYINQDEYEAAVREPNTARVHKPDIEIYAPYLAEMVRSAIVKQYEDKAYTQGYHVYTTLDSDIQQHAANALRKALLDYDRRHGYRGAEDQIVLDDYAGREEWLDKLSTYTPIDGMQAALVIKANTEQAELLLLNEETITLTLDDVSWARPFIKADRRGRKPKKVTDVLYPGDIVRVRQQTDQNNDRNKADKANRAETAKKWQLTQIPKVGGALVVLDPENGAIRAVMGGFDFYLSKFNRATQAMRQPGSSFKPIIYSAAMTRGLNPASIVNDAPITVPGTDWSPKNYGGSYIGPTTIAEALAKSRNLVSIRLLRTTGIPYTIDYAMRFGYQRKNLPPNLTLALGTGLTTPLQMATAYATFANGGFKVDSHFINRIEDNSGKVVYDASTKIKRACGDNKQFCPLPKTAAELETGSAGEDGQKQTDTAQTDPTETVIPDQDTTEDTGQAPAAVRIMDSRTNKYIVNMMQGVTRFGTAARAGRILKRKDIAGKTGTTNDQKDSWFCGFTPDYVAVAWAGFDDMAELGDGETSTKIAVPMWTDLMQQVLKDTPQKPWKKHGDKLQTVKIDADTGKVASADSENIVEEELAEQQANTRAPAGFVFTDAQTATQTAQQRLQQQLQQQQLQQGQQAFWDNNANTGQPAATTPPPQPAPAPKSEAVEIPEQIF